ncbi:2-oxoglutarate and iron-dependent oxygenase domain-containing protein 3 [Manacus vitellinus]|uniref:2-oxoglutarate and iron-dependent oxygenase domain-containing protein 3 n=1 Tax=Manacus vitellinus TaxID=328815 RepID=UPI00115CFA4E|nr:2-oxoglutarate and iron-dependent oxygenase domain-containing protein 3 [Manacus vitellinus]
MCPKLCTSGTTSRPCARARLSTARSSAGLGRDTSVPQGTGGYRAGVRCPQRLQRPRIREGVLIFQQQPGGTEGTEQRQHLREGGDGGERPGRDESCCPPPLLTCANARKGRSRQDPRGWRAKAAALLLLFTAAVGGLVLWSRLLAQGGISGDGILQDGVTEVLAHRSDSLRDKFVEIPCSEDYDSHRRFEGCTPRRCGRGVSDAIITREEAERIRRIAERGLSLGGSDGGASILDLHSGALSLGKHFVNLYRYFGDKIHDIFTEEDFALYRDVRQRIQQRIAEVFGISSSSMYLTKPTFFSRMNSTEAKTTHDEYWHPHVDKVTYGSFDYTSLLYLSDYTQDFGGGRFVFLDADSNKTVEPRAGRVSFFTSGSENLHRVEKVLWGTRFAITISFTCNPEHGIGDPVLG